MQSLAGAGIWRVELESRAPIMGMKRQKERVAGGKEGMLGRTDLAWHPGRIA
jgi:hypothetical protein